MAGRTTEQKYKEQKQPNLNIYIHAFPVTFAQETSTSRRVPLLRKESVDLYIVYHDKFNYTIVCQNNKQIVWNLRRRG